MSSQAADQLKSLGTIMGIWAHPDDETLLSGGLMALAARNGQNVVCVTATKGEHGSQDPIRWPESTLASVRALELVEALQTLGIKHHHWLDYHDAACAKIPDAQAVAKLTPLIAKYQPDTIITFPPDGITGHNDHKAVSRWAVAAAQQATKRPAVYYAVVTQEAYGSHLKAIDEKINIFFNVAEPKCFGAIQCDMYLALPPDIAAKKSKALSEMPSQYTTMFNNFAEDFVKQAFGTEAFMSAAKLDRLVANA